MSDFVPRNDKELSDWMENFLTVLTPDLAVFQLEPADIALLETVSMAFTANVAAYEAAKLVLTGKSATKKSSRKSVEMYLRPLVRRINNHPAMNEDMRANLGLKPKNLVQETPPISDLVPEIYLEMFSGGVVVHWGPNPQNENRNGRPAGVKGVNIYRKKAGEADFQMLAHTTRSPYRDYVTGDAADYTYVARYYGTKVADMSMPSVAETIAARGDLAA